MKSSLLLLVIPLALLAACSSIAPDGPKRAATVRIVEEATTSAPPFVAYSLREAAAQLKNPRASAADLKSLGGITALAGVVYDRAGEDLILVGQASPDLQPISIDHLAVALKAVLVHDELPLVSIEPNVKTRETGFLDVVFRGQIANTSYGHDMLAADVALKKLILGILPANDLGVASYLDQFAADSREHTSERITQSRFWFDVAGEPALSVRDDTIVIRKLRIAVQEEVLYRNVDGRTVDTASPNDKTLGAQFSRDLTAAYFELGQAYPEIARVKTLLDLVALARGVEQLEIADSPVLGFWLASYGLAAQTTPQTVALLTERKDVQDRDGNAKVVELSGGVRLSARVIRLRSGATGAFREATLDSRPSQNTLSWRVPLDGWNIPDALGVRRAEPPKQDSKAQRADGEGERQGTVIEAQVRSSASAPLMAPVPQQAPVRQPPAFGIFDSLDPVGPDVVAKNTIDSRIVGYPVPQYHALAKAYLATDSAVGKFLRDQPAQRALFGFPLTAPSPDTHGAATTDSQAWRRYDFAPEPLPGDNTVPPVRLAGSPPPVPKLPTPLRPGGILLAPELEIVVDAHGVTDTFSRKAVKALAANKLGGQFTHEGTTYSAVRAYRGPPRRVEIPVGKFVLQQKDILAGNRNLALDRFYDSTSNAPSPLGPHWSLVPFSLENDGSTSMNARGGRVFRRPVLRDWQTGLELKYRFENTGDTGYKPLGADQPYLTFDDAQYVAVFANGLVARFDAAGRLQVVALRGTSPQTTYQYQDGRLISITGTAGKIDLQYALGGSLRRAVADNGREVLYDVDRAGRLIKATAHDTSYQFAYTEMGHLKKVAKATSGGRAESVVENTYDRYGRMLRHETPRGHQEFGYDDRLGKATVRDSKGQTTFYYDSLGRLVAYGEKKESMTLLNYDDDGRILQIASGRLVNDPTVANGARFRVSAMVTP